MVRSRLLPALLVVGLAAAQGVILQRLFPLESVLGPERIYNEDYGKTLYYTELGRTFLRESFRLDGYSPDFYAGFRTHPTYHSCTFLQVAAFLLPGVSTPVLLKVFVALLPVLLPLIFAAAARRFGLTRGRSALAALFGCLTFYFNGTYYLYWVGTITYLWAVYLSPLTASLLVRWLRRRAPVDLAGGGLLLALNLMLHPYSVLPLTAFLLPALFVERKRLSIGAWACLAGTGALAVGANLPWLADFFVPAPDTVREVVEVMKEESFVFRLPPMLTLKILAGPAQIALLGLAFLGCRASWRERSAGGGFWTGVALVSLLLSLPLLLLPAFYFMTPMRMFTFLFATLAFPAGIGLCAFLGPLFAREGRGRAWRRPAAGRLAAASAVAVYALVWHGVARQPVASTFGVVRPFLTSPPAAVVEPARWILEHTDESARILFEDQKVYTYFGVRPVLHVQAATGRAFIGGPVCDSNIRTLRVDFHDGHLGFRKLAGVPRAEFDAFLTNYNIGWALCWSEEAKAYFQGWPERFRPMGAAGGMACYAVLRTPEDFLLGQGEARAGYDRIDLRDLRPEGGRVRISYHHVPGMRLQGKGRLNPVPVEGDPQPLLEILDPGTEAAIVYDP